MRYLLDTHTLLWALSEPESLTERVRQILADPHSDLLVSLVVPWELAIKSASGKLQCESILNEFESILHRGGYRMLDSTVEQVLLSGSLPLHHRDPFDRLLIAQSLLQQLPILSCDAIFDRYGVQRVWR